MSLRLRLVLALLPLVVLAIGVAEIATYSTLQSYLLNRTDQQLMNNSVSILRALQPQSNNNGFGGPPGGSPPDTGGVPSDTVGEILTSSGSRVTRDTFGFNVNQSAGPVLPSGIARTATSSAQYSTVAGTDGIGHYRIMVQTIVGSGGEVLIVAIPIDDVDSTLSQLLLVDAIVTAITLVLLSTVMMLVVRAGLLPLERMAITARSIVASRLDRRIEPASERTEVGRLGLALNEMLDQLSAAFAAQLKQEQRLRDFISDASHELRTPLTSMRGYAELFERIPTMPRADVELSMRRISDETRRMGVLVDDLLLLARLDQGRDLEQDYVDVSSLIEDAVADARVTDPVRTIELTLDGEPTVLGDELRLRQVFANVLRNALIHTPAGTPIEVSGGIEASQVVVSVADHGAGVPDADRQRIFERFHRAAGRAADEGGSGLGLSIVTAVVAAHGGTVDVSPTAGGGATFRIALPRASAAELTPTGNSQTAPRQD